MGIINTSASVLSSWAGCSKTISSLHVKIILLIFQQKRLSLSMKSVKLDQIRSKPFLFWQHLQICVCFTHCRRQFLNKKSGTSRQKYVEDRNE